MVLTDLPFDRYKLLHSRYDLLRPESAPNPFISQEEKSKNSEEAKAYASFLKAQERNVGPIGFLDSNRYSYTYTLKREKSSPRAKSRFRASSDNVVSFSSLIKENEKDYQKKMKVIEDHMWQHKQEERELKRIEGDIIKNQHAVRHTLRDYENAVNKKRYAEEKKLNHSLERFTLMSREHLLKKEEESKKHTFSNLTDCLVQKNTSRRHFIRLSDLERLYTAKRAAIDLKRSELKRLSQDFETKLRQKEEEQIKLKQELADLAITLNLEAQKSRVQKFDFEKSRKTEKTERIQEDLKAQKNLDQNLLKSNNDIKDSMMAKNQLDMDLALTKAHLEIKKRDEQRHLTDTQYNLNHNSIAQRNLNKSAMFAGLDLKTKSLEQKVEVHNIRRKFRINNYVQNKQEKEQAQNAVLMEKFKARELEAQRYKHEDALKFFQKMVHKSEEREQSLYSKVRIAEYNRQQQDHSVRSLQNSLAELKRVNAATIKNEIVDKQHEEESLKQKLYKEKSELDKVNAQREESYWKLQELRVRLKEDKHVLENYEKEHNRLLKIGSKSDSMMNTSNGSLETRMHRASFT